MVPPVVSLLQATCKRDGPCHLQLICFRADAVIVVIISSEMVFKRNSVSTINSAPLIFQSFWMTSDENFKIIKRIEQENAKKEADQKEKENIKKEAVMKHRKVKAAIKRKQIKNVAKKIKSNPKL